MRVMRAASAQRRMMSGFEGNKALSVSVARIERSEIRDRPINTATPPPGFAGAQPGLRVLSAALALSAAPLANQSSGSTLTMAAPWLLPVQKVTGVVGFST